MTAGLRALQEFSGKSGAMIPGTLIEEVRWNCDIATAGQSGHFSLCGMLLRLRQLYKWEHGLAPWQEPEVEAVLAWIARRESTWDELEEASWRDLAWGDAVIDPFAVETLNAYLIPLKLAYGAGLSRGLTPTFFLGELLEERRLGDLTILVLGPELARDMDASPALCQGTLIYARRQALAFYLWDRLSDPTQQGNAYLQLALKAHNLRLKELVRDPEAHQEGFQAFLAGELEAVIHHEIGEALEPSLKAAFPAVLERFPQTKVELFVRTLKDALADVNEWGRLAYIIGSRNLPSLAVMLAWRPGLLPKLLPELEPGFQKFMATGDWGAMEEARQQALDRLRETARGLNAMLESSEASSNQWLQEEIKRCYLSPLGL
ncbi:MAG: Sfum_1244 family protein [Desulfobaccales bacterium]